MPDDQGGPALELRRQGVTAAVEPGHDDATAPRKTSSSRAWCGGRLSRWPRSWRTPRAMRCPWRAWSACSVGLGSRQGQGVALGRRPTSTRRLCAVTRWLVVNTTTNARRGAADEATRAKSVQHLPRQARWRPAAAASEVLEAEDRLRMGRDGPERDVSHDLVFTWADGRMIRPDTWPTGHACRWPPGCCWLTPPGIRHSFATAWRSGSGCRSRSSPPASEHPRGAEVYRHVIPAEGPGGAAHVGDLFRQRGVTTPAVTNGRRGPAEEDRL